MEKIERLMLEKYPADKKNRATKSFNFKDVAINFTIGTAFLYSVIEQEVSGVKKRIPHSFHHNYCPFCGVKHADKPKEPAA